MLKNNKHIVISAIILLAITAGIISYVNYLINKPLDIEIPKHFIYNNTKIALAWTDDNTGENLIIQSDKKNYYGFSSAEIYFSITNTLRRDQDMDIVIWLPSEKSKAEKVERINKDGSNFEFPISNFESISNDLMNKFSNRKDVGGSSNGYAVNDEIKSGQTNYYKATLKYPPMSKGEFFIEAFGCPFVISNGAERREKSLEHGKTVNVENKTFKGFLADARNDKIAYGHLDPWYSSSWSYRRQVTLQSSQIATTTSAFPVLATTTLADLRTTTNGGKVGNDNGYDIVFTDTDGETVLNYEREKYASTTGEIAYWIKTDISSTTDKVIYMYYGSSTSSDQATTTGVWDDNYVMVQHMHHDWDASAVDSTKYDNDGTNNNFYSATSSVSTGQVDGAIDFDGGDDYVNVNSGGANDLVGGASGATVSAWIKITNDATRKIIFHDAWLVNSQTRLRVEIQTDETIELGARDDTYASQQTVVTDSAISCGVWHHITALFDIANDNIDIYVDGSKPAQTGSAIFAQSTFDTDATTWTNIGAAGGINTLFFNGLIDEVRISNVARTAQWIETEYNNQVSVGSFMTIGAEQDNTPTEFVSRIRAAGDAGEFTKLSTWESEVDCNLTATTTRVFSGTATGAITSGNTLEWFSNNIYQNVTATLVSTSSTQILLKNITGVNYDLVMQSGDQWRLASSTLNMWEVSGTTGNELGDTVIAVAECYNDWPSAGLDDKVNLHGWTTNSTNYIKIYAPAGERHNGIIKSGGNYTGFTLREIGSTYDEIIDIAANYTRIEGIIFDLNYQAAFNVRADALCIRIEHCIFTKGSGTSGYGALELGANSAYVSNCLFQDNSYEGIFVNGSSNSYVYNCTFADNKYGLNMPNYSTNSFTVKNCLAYSNSTKDFNFSDASATANYCASSDNTADDLGGAGNRIGQTFTFVDEANDDFHLASADTGAKGYGTDLSSDSNYAVTDDIDYQTRTGAWDIGADQFNETVHLIRKTYTIDSSSGDISRSSNVVTVNLTSAHDNLKVGQTIKVWDVDDSSFDGYFAIASVAFTTQFTYAQSGSNANSANGSVGGDYELLSTWETAQQRDLVTAQQIEVAECYNDWSSGLDDRVTIDGWTTDATHYIKVYAPSGERHDGTAGTGFRISPSSKGDVFYIKETYTIIEGVEIFDYNSWNHDAIELRSGYCAISHCLIHEDSNGSGPGVTAVYASTPDNSNTYIYNNIIYGLIDNGIVTYWRSDLGYAIYVYNNTIIGMDIHGIKAYAGTSFFPKKIISKNNLVKGSATADFATESYGELINYNSVSSDGTADDFGGAGNRINQTFTFVDEANDDFHLAGTDSGARNQGTDLSADADYPFSTDIDGYTRPYGGLWDIGADEASGYAVTKINSPYTDSGNWYDANWKYKRAIVLNNSQISTTTSSFPILATTTLADLKSYAYDGHVGSNSGHDIIFVDDDNSTLLNFEREKYDPATGEIAYWIKTDISSTTDKTIYMYYGNASASDQENPSGVWGDSALGVWLMNEGTGVIYDSVSNVQSSFSNDVTWVSDGIKFGALGKVDTNVEANAGINSEFTYVLKVKWYASENEKQSIMGYNNPANTNYYNIICDQSDNSPALWTVDNGWDSCSVDSNVNYADGNIVYIVAVRDGTTTKIYTQGVFRNSKTSAAYGNIYVSGQEFHFGWSDIFYDIPNVEILHAGAFDRAFSAGWIETEYNNQVSVGDFMTFGAEESLNRVVIVNAPITSYLTDGLVGHWTFNGQDMDWASTTAEALDRSGNSNNGNVIGAKAVIGKVGQGLEFDGVDDYVDVPDADSLDATSVTLSAWVKSGTVGRYILAKDPPGVEFYDTFTEATITELSVHNPDTGTGWTRIIAYESDLAVLNVQSSGYVGPPLLGNVGTLYETDDTMSSADYDVEVTQVNGDTGDDYCYIAARIQGAGDMYVLQWNEDAGSVELWECVGGAWNLLDSTWASGIADTSIVKLSVEGTTIKGYDDATEMFSITNSSHSSAGKAGIGAGDIGLGYISADLSTQEFDNFTVTVTGAAGKSDVPYALSTVGGGQFLIMNNGTTYTATSTTDINDNEWHHIVGSYDGTTMKIYIDGNLEDTNTDFSGNLPTNTENVKIGADYQSTLDNFFDGLIDETRIYNRALSADEIGELYRAGARKMRLN